MKIVRVSEIPTRVENTPLDKLSELYATGQQMEILCNENSRACGLSAVQVGIPWKFFIYYDNRSKSYNYMVDCEYEPLSKDTYLSFEGCLSMKNRYFKVQRHSKILVKGKKLVGRNKIELEDFEEIIDSSGEPDRANMEVSIANRTLFRHLGAVFQHEIDHQNNILIADIGEEVSLDIVQGQTI